MIELILSGALLMGGFTMPVTEYDIEHEKQAKLEQDYAYEQELEQQEWIDLQTLGVVWWGGQRFTWYSSEVLWHYRTDEFVLNPSGYWCYDGYLVCASQDYEQGTVIETPWGLAMVLDYCETPNTIDMYVGW